MFLLVLTIRETRNSNCGEAKLVCHSMLVRIAMESLRRPLYEAFYWGQGNLLLTASGMNFVWATERQNRGNTSPYPLRMLLLLIANITTIPLEGKPASLILGVNTGYQFHTQHYLLWGSTHYLAFWPWSWSKALDSPSVAHLIGITAGKSF